jgi:preprotein translocase subunit YajC
MQQQGQEQNPYSMLIMMGLIVVVFYFFMIRPQMKKRKELEKFRNEIAKGDKVLTIGGIHGKVVEINEDSIIIETEGQTKLRMDKNAIIKSATEMIAQR